MTTTPYLERIEAVRRLAEAAEVDALAEELMSLSASTRGDWVYYGRKAVGAIQAQPLEVRIRLLLRLLDRRRAVPETDRAGLESLIDIMNSYLPAGLPADVARILLDRAAGSWAYGPLQGLVNVARSWQATGAPLPGEVVAVIRRTALTNYWEKGPLHEMAATLTEPALNPGEAWTDAVLAELPTLGDGWTELLTHAATATASKPTARWEKQGRTLLAKVGPDVFRRHAVGWLPLVGRPRTVTLARRDYEPEYAHMIDPFNANALRGLVWLLGLLPPEPETARALGGLVETALRKVPGIGPRSPKVANAAVYALSRMDGEAALAQLARLATRVTFKGTLKEVNGALDRRATALGLTREEVEELGVPAYGLTEVGRRVEAFGDATAEVTVVGSAVTVAWRTAAGKAVKAAPAAVRRDHGDALKELKATVKDIEKMLSVQAERLDRQFLAQRSWTLSAWRDRYLDHPLVGTLARRLIWLVDDQPCGYADGALRTVDDGELLPDDTATVRLWHPVDHVNEVLAWRGWLERHGITQPFKQAHREVYLLTAAEERTRVYSNRYAAHILRQHQFHALAATRGWRNRLRLMVDDEYPPATRELPQWGLRAEFWVEGVADDYGQDTTESGTYLRLATDQVRFYPLTAPENSAHAGGGGYQQWLYNGADPVAPLPLDQVPALVFSEVMRDVDLFVGVASVGNDPTWQDGGPEGRYREYWTSYSFGELSATAETRRDLLGRLVPRLAIADRCTLDGRFLVVRGDLRTYRIHLGSGNILMSPNDQYLCIVPKQAPESATGGMFLPFEGDRMLAVILSKALLLARDTAITDPTITQQLRR